MCGHSGISLTTPGCPNCGNQRCAYCDVTKIRITPYPSFEYYGVPGLRSSAVDPERRGMSAETYCQSGDIAERGRPSAPRCSSCQLRSTQLSGINEYLCTQHGWSTTTCNTNDFFWLSCRACSVVWPSPDATYQTSPSGL